MKKFLILGLLGITLLSTTPAYAYPYSDYLKSVGNPLNAMSYEEWYNSSYNDSKTRYNNYVAKYGNNISFDKWRGSQYDEASWCGPAEDTKYLKGIHYGYTADTSKGWSFSGGGKDSPFSPDDYVGFSKVNILKNYDDANFGKGFTELSKFQDWAHWIAVHNEYMYIYGNRIVVYSDDGKSLVKDDWRQVDGKSYYFASNGAAIRGWLVSDSKWYHFDLETAQMQKGWQRGQGDTGSGAYHDWYYFDPYTGEMATGTKIIDGVTYTFNNYGIMQ